MLAAFHGKLLQSFSFFQPDAICSKLMQINELVALHGSIKLSFVLRSFYCDNVAAFVLLLYYSRGLGLASVTLT